MNNVVLKGKLGAGFNDDRYTLPKDGNPGDILVKTETGSEWQKQEPAETLPTDGNPGDILVKTETGSAWQKQDQGDGSRYIINGHSWNYNGVNYICTDEPPDQLMMMYESGKDIFLYFNGLRLQYTGSLFYTIMATHEDNTGIKEASIAVIGNPAIPNINWNCPYKGICNFGVFPFNIQSEG